MTPPGEPLGGRRAPTWVVGARGLLGNAVRQAVTAAGDEVRPASVPWSDPEAAVEALLSQADALPDDGWRLAWCAGSGVVASTPDQFEQELAVLAAFLERWQPRAEPARRAVFMASSAGGVYAGSSGPPFTESTEPVPISPYGHAKLRAEALFRAFAERTGTPLLVGRIANLYGPGQDLGKGQGLISLLCEAHLRRRPLSVYVPLDTMRDYLYVTDAAATVVACLDRLGETGGTHVRILASGRSVTVGQILGELRRVSRRRPPMILGSSPVARFQVPDLRLRPEVWPSLDRHASTPLAVGIASCLAAVEASLRSPLEHST
ncbi:NAD-dependent epimerase/dehydratase family protein [Marmoricola sp. RAF53]|uniref:NAD-dependent epimerase/dehydratase family protein n=1 Tax=Marmoricola sp. RAF53 TaxID=3233059 RepID=UPI003F9BC501